MSYFELANESTAWTDIEPDPQVTYEPWRRRVPLLDGGIRGLGSASVVWDWGQTLMHGDRLRTLQQFCPDGVPSARVRMRTLTDEMSSSGLRRQREFLGVMHRVEVSEHVQRMTRDWARGVTVEFSELVALPGFEQVDSLAFNTDFDLLTDMELDVDGGFGYFACVDLGPTNSRLVKVSLSDMVVVDELIFPSDIVWAPYRIALDLPRNRLYCGDNASPEQLWIVELMGFEYVDEVTLPGGDSQAADLIMDDVAGYLYVALTGPDPAEVHKIRVSDFTVIDSLVLAVGEDKIGVGSCALDAENGYLYVGVDGTPGSIVKIRTSDMTRIAASTMVADENRFGSAVLDVDRDRGYFGASTISLSTNIAEIRLSDMVRVGAAVGDTLENEYYWRGLALDKAAGYLYGAASRVWGTPSHIVRFSYPDLVRVGMVELGASDYGVFGLEHDPHSGYLYTCHYTTPGRVAKIGGGL